MIVIQITTSAILLTLALIISGLSLWLLKATARRPGRSRCPIHPEAARIVFHFQVEREDSMNLKVNRKLSMTISAEDKFDNQTGFDKAPAWSLNDPSLAELAVSEDGMSAKLTPSGKLGACEVHVLGESGGKQISGKAEISLIAGDAVEIAINATELPEEEAPAPQPETPAAA